MLNSIILVGSIFIASALLVKGLDWWCYRPFYKKFDRLIGAVKERKYMACASSHSTYTTSIKINI